MLRLSGLAAMRLPGPHVLLSALNEPLDGFKAVSYARPDFQEIRWLAEEPATPNRRYGNLQELGNLVFGEKCFKLGVSVCHVILSGWPESHLDARITLLA